jgi:predicted short-subunit dehydrogenase-like oxidoreductase (DUF2520 family)
VVLHVSGATGGAPLAPLRRHGAAVGSMHPLAVFPPPGRPARDFDLTGTFFAVEGDPAARGAAAAIARALGGRSLRLAASRRVSWHLAAALAANGLVALMDAAIGTATRQAGLKEAAARGGLVRLARSALAALEHDPPARALTGPAARGDAATLRRHLAALRQADPGLLPLYRLLSGRAVDLARADGRLTPRQAASLRRLLGIAPARARRRPERPV